MAFTFFRTQLGKPLASDLRSITSSLVTCLHWETTTISTGEYVLGWSPGSRVCSSPSRLRVFSSPGRASGPASTARWRFAEFPWDHSKRWRSCFQGAVNKCCCPSHGRFESGCALTPWTWRGAVSALGRGGREDQSGEQSHFCKTGQSLDRQSRCMLPSCFGGCRTHQAVRGVSCWVQVPILNQSHNNRPASRVWGSSQVCYFSQKWTNPVVLKSEFTTIFYF